MLKNEVTTTSDRLSTDVRAIMAAAHGGQVLCSTVTAALASHQLPDRSSLRDLGAHRLRDLSESEHIFQLVHPGLPDGFGPLRSLDSYRSNLPIQPTAFVGREAEVCEIAKALEEARLVTLCGVGGVGKTRLALQVAAEVLPLFEDGTWVVELASVGAVDVVGEAVASALGVQQSPGKTLDQGVLDFLTSTSLLLVLDNCEHLLNPVAKLVDSLLKAAPGVRVLATSREGLAVSGEHLITVPSLQTPDNVMGLDELLSTESVRLFTERARESSNVKFGPDDATAVAELCRRLDGIPLAIELAAVRIRVMTPKEMVEHLDRRFRLLTAGRRTAVTRHQTLKSTIDWSYDLLEETERGALRRLSVFSGDFDMAAAESVVADDDIDPFDVSDLLFRLVDKSLVVADASSGTTRFRLLETIRDYAWERMDEAGESEDTAGRHSRHFLELVENLGPGLRDQRELESKERINRDLDNVRTAFRWAVDAGDAEMALRFVDAVSVIAVIRTPFGTLPEEAARLPGAVGNPLAAIALASAAAAFSGQGEPQRAAELVDEALESAGAVRGSLSGDHAFCRVCENVTMVAHLQSDSTRFIEVARAWLQAANELDDPFEVSESLNLLAGITTEADEAIKAGEESLVLARRLGSPSRIAHASIILGMRLSVVGDDRSESLFAEALDAAIAAQNDWVDSFAAQQLGLMQARKGALAAAAKTLLETAERAMRKGDHYAIAITVSLMACVLATVGDDEAALVLGAWGRKRHLGGFQLGGPTLEGLSESYLTLVDRQSSTYVEILEQKASSMNDAELLALAQRHVGNLTVVRVRG